MSGVILVAGGGGFIGGHLVARLLQQGKTVRAVDCKPISDWFQRHEQAENISLDLEIKENCYAACEAVDVVYNLACNMGGMGFIENNKALCMVSVLINTHLLLAVRDKNISKYFFASSACVYPMNLQSKTDIIALAEDTVYPAMPEDGYGWEKLFGERMCENFHQDFGIDVRVARFHNVYGPHGSWNDGREKAPAAICRKVVEAIQNQTFEIEVWGDGEQTRSFMYIDDCLEGIEKLMQSDYTLPVNIGRSEMVSINELVAVVSEIAVVEIKKNHKIDAPLGVRGRNSDNTLIRKTLGWEPSIPLNKGIKPLYEWVKQQSDFIKPSE